MPVVLEPRWNSKRTAEATLTGALKGFWRSWDPDFVIEVRADAQIHRTASCEVRFRFPCLSCSPCLGLRRHYLVPGFWIVSRS
jgi:hypothetical protein